jgi:transposase
MSPKPERSYTVPQDTADVVHAVFPDGNLYTRMYDAFGTLFQDDDFSALFPKDGQPAESPFRLMLVLILQFSENLSDRQAAEAVRTRIDWKYLLCLPLMDMGFHYSVLSEFRTRLLPGETEAKLFEKLLEHLRSKDLLRGQKRQRTDSTHILGAIRAINRLMFVGETMRQALNALAVAAPDWLRNRVPSEWIDRYGDRIEDFRLAKSEAKRIAYAEEIGADGVKLFNMLFEQISPNWLRELPAIRILWRVWIQNYTWQSDDRLRWRNNDEISPSAVFISSPYDEEAHDCQKRSTSWVGYKVHLTETCDDEAPRLITHVETTPATTADSDLTIDIQTELRAKGISPKKHLVDLGYIDAKILVTSKEEFGIDVIGPPKGDYRWQARAGEGFAAENFIVDWQLHQTTCPTGRKSISWTPALDARKQEVIKIKFSQKDCIPCLSRSKCTHAQKHPRRTITLRAQPQHEALQATKEREKTESFKELYARRAGIEGTISQSVRSFDLRRTRYIGMAKSHLQHVLIAMAINLVRAVRWIAGEKLAITRQSAFVKLCQPAPL